jgi:hypothetical protein
MSLSARQGPGRRPATAVAFCSATDRTIRKPSRQQLTDQVSNQTPLA